MESKVPEMEKSSKRGKIPQSDWPLIMSRYEAGETLASIARTYDCSPPAISYVVSRSRARHPGGMPPQPSAMPSANEPQLIKAPAAEPAFGLARPQPIAASPIAAPPVAAAPASAPPLIGTPRHDGQPPRPEAPSAGSGVRRDEMRPREMPPEANGFAGSGAGHRDAHLPDMPPRPASPLHRPPAPPMPGPGNGDPRRTLHLSLGTATQGNGAAHSAEIQPADRQNFLSHGQPQPPSQAAPEHLQPPADRGPQHNAPIADFRQNGGVTPGAAAAAPAAYPQSARRGDRDGAPRKEGGGSFIDNELRARVDDDISAFLAAFDAALAADTRESRSSLREATDRLLRAGARTRIELERLEARVPLPPRDAAGRSEPAWRQR